MKQNKSTNIKTADEDNLIGNEAHRSFIALQSSYGFAFRGGSYPHQSPASTASRLISNINILTKEENKQLVFSLPVFNN